MDVNLLLNVLFLLYITVKERKVIVAVVGGFVAIVVGGCYYVAKKVKALFLFASFKTRHFITSVRVKHNNKKKIRFENRIAKMTQKIKDIESEEYPDYNHVTQEQWDIIGKAWTIGKVQQTLKDREAREEKEGLSDDALESIGLADTFEITVIVGANDEKEEIIVDAVKGYNSCPLKLKDLGLELSLQQINSLAGGTKIKFTEYMVDSIEPDNIEKTLFFSANRRRAMDGLNKYKIESSYYYKFTISKTDLYSCKDDIILAIESANTAIEEAAITIENKINEVVFNNTLNDLDLEDFNDLDQQQFESLIDAEVLNFLPQNDFPFHDVKKIFYADRALTEYEVVGGNI